MTEAVGKGAGVCENGGGWPAQEAEQETEEACETPDGDVQATRGGRGTSLCSELLP